MFIHRLSSIDHISELEKTYERTTGLKEISDGRSWSEIIKDVQSLSPSRQRTLLLMNSFRLPQREFNA